MSKRQIISDYFATIGSRGGAAGTGAVKARSSEQARAAVKARWARVRAAKRQRKAAHS